MRLLALGLVLSAAGLLAPASVSAAPGALHTGFLDGAVSFDPSPALRAEWLGRIRAQRADRIRIDILWNQVAPKPPAPGEDPRDPAWAGYSWVKIDAAVQESLAAGLAPILTVRSAPVWAQQGAAPPGTPPGAWKPDPAALGAFATAVARRFTGRVRYFQAWNEPNLDTYLAPQWAGGRPFAPAWYRGMLNAFYDAVKAVGSSNVVISAGTAPFGDPGRSGHRMMPALFVRTLLCFKDRALHRAPCPAPAQFDVLDHHPYSVRGPEAPALNEDDASVPDLGKLSRPLRRAVRTGSALPRKPKKLWTTEISWDSQPQDPDGVPAQTHARWLEQAMHALWRQGVDMVLWYLVRDAPPIPSYEATYQSGIFQFDGVPKPAARAFAFPFVAEPARGGRIQLWGKAPGARSRVTIERFVRGRWRTLTNVAAGPGAIFSKRVHGKRGWRLRATARGEASLTWTVGRA